jgi:low affinity Fe/Cu permease
MFMRPATTVSQIVGMLAAMVVMTTGTMAMAVRMTAAATDPLPCADQPLA